MEGRRGGVRQGKQGQLGGRGPSRMGGISSWQEEGRMESMRIRGVVADMIYMGHNKLRVLEELRGLKE